MAIKSKSQRAGVGIATAIVLASCPVPAAAQTVQELQRQIDELKAQIKALTDAQKAAVVPASPSPVAAVPTPAPQVAASTPAPSPTPAPAQPQRVAVVAKPPSARAPWYERLRLRGYTQLRYNAILDDHEPLSDTGSRLRSVHDSSINDDGGFLLRRVRLVLQGISLTGCNSISSMISARR